MVSWNAVFTDRVASVEPHRPSVDDVAVGHGDARLQQEDVVVFPRLNDRRHLLQLSVHATPRTTAPFKLSRC